MTRIDPDDRSTWPPEGEDVLVWSDYHHGWFVWALRLCRDGGEPGWSEFFVEIGYVPFERGNWWHPLPSSPEGAA